MTILIIEDDKMLSEMYRDKFQVEGFEVNTATDGQKGLETALHNKPDLILLDIALPKMDGIEIMGKLRADLWGKTAKIIVLTNVNIDSKVLDGIMSYSPSYCLTKSDTTPEDLIVKAKEITSSN